MLMLFPCGPEDAVLLKNRWMKRREFDDLPLNGWRVPPYLAERMTKMGADIADHLICLASGGYSESRWENSDERSYRKVQKGKGKSHIAAFALWYSTVLNGRN